MYKLRVGRISFLLATFLVVVPLAAKAQFGNLMQQLQKLQSPAAQGSIQPLQPGGARKGNGMAPSDQWCSQQVGALGRMQVDTAVIASEFKVPDLEALQDEFQKALRKDKISKTFPSARFFQASFETKRVRAIYDSFLAFPEPETLAALIQLSRAQDQQERSDAQMALTFLHMQAPELSINKDRWWNLYQSALGVEHFTALVFRARVNAYGEYGAKDLGQALGDLVSAGNLRSQYGQGGGMSKEFDTQNYQIIHTSTAKDIYFNEPKMPYRQLWQGPAETAMQIEQAQLAYSRQIPNTRVGRMYAEANKINAESIEIGNSIIKKTRDGNQLTGQLESLKSLRANAPGEKQVFEDISPEVQSSQIKMIAKMGSFDDEQKKMLVQAQEKRLTAQGIISQSYSELLGMLMANMGSDMVKMAAPLPVLTQANNALIQSCIISAKWEQAMRAKDVPKVDLKKAESQVADLSEKYKD
jgi:hypothetical protein